jgi:Domain of unknown function (DUF1707)
MASPGDETTAGSGGHLRASHADRDHVIDGLKAAFVEGRLEQDEFAQRVSRALASRTYADLGALTADLPPARLPAQPPAPAREPMSRNTIAAIWGTFAGAVLLACWNLLPESSGPVEMLMLLGSFIVLAAGPLGWLLVFHDWLEKRGPRQTAAGRPPGTGGPAFPHRDQAGPARQVPPADRDPGLTSEAAPRAPGPLRPRIAAAHG